MPALSVVMPVHNALPHLDAAIESILNQTFRDFEFVILDDASTDGSSERLREWAKRDERIRLLHVAENLGPVHSSNKVAREARAPLVARMDADDISHPERLAEGLKILTDHPEVGVVASVSDMIDAKGRTTRDPELWRLRRRSVFVPFAHGSMIYRQSVFDQVGGYRIESEYWEDQDLIVRMAEVAEVAVVLRPLYRVRQSPTSTRLVSNQHQMERALAEMYRTTDELAQSSHSQEAGRDSGNEDGKLDPRVFIAIGSVRLWAGGRPHLFKRLLSKGALSPNFRTISAIVWTAWAEVSPSTLRTFMMMLLKGRNRLASISAPETEAVLWRPQAPPRKLTREVSKPCR